MNALEKPPTKRLQFHLHTDVYGNYHVRLGDNIDSVYIAEGKTPEKAKANAKERMSALLHSL